jgi:AP-1 complex subunit gamma-1
MLAISSPDIKPGSSATQQMRVIAPAGVSLVSHGRRFQMLITRFQAQVRLRLRFNFTTSGRAVQDQTDFSSFPADLTAAK